MIQFLHPAFLWGLSAIAIPVAIHLLSLKEGKVILIGSLRHFTGSPAKNSKSIRLNELLLLTLRILIIIWLVALLAGIYLTARFTSPKKWLLIEKGIEKETRF